MFIIIFRSKKFNDKDIAMLRPESKYLFDNVGTESTLKVPLGLKRLGGK